MKKSIPYLLVLLIALVALWWWLGKREAARQQGAVPEAAGFADSLTVSRFVLSRHNQPDLEFEKDADGVWMMTKPLRDRANINLVRQMIQGVSTMKLLVRVSGRSSQFSSFSIDDVQGARLQSYAGDQLASDLYIGKLSPDAEHVYVRQAGSDDVYTATGGGGVAALRTRATNDYRDRQIYSFEVADIDSLDVEGDGIQYRYAREDTVTWRVSIKGGPYQKADQPTALSTVLALGALRASGFYEDSTALDWSRPLLAVRVWKLGGATERLEFLKIGEENNYWARAEGNPHVYKVFQSAFQTFRRDPKTLVAPAS